MTQSLALPINLSGTAFDGVQNLAGASSATGLGAVPGLFSGLVESAEPVVAGASVLAGLTADETVGGTPDVSALLASLQGDVSSGVTSAADPLAALQALLQGNGLNISNALPADGVVTAPAVTPATDPLQALAAALQQTQQTLQAAGIQPQSLTTHDGLVKALQVLGVPAEKVEGMASTIESALAKFKKNLNIRGGQAADQLTALAQVMVAASVLPQLADGQGKPLLKDSQPLTFTVQKADSSAQTVALAGARQAQASDALKQASALPATTSLAREVAGLKDGSKTEDKPAADAAAPVADSVFDATLPAVAVTIDPVGVTVRDVQKTPTAVTTKTAPVQNVNANSILAPASGDVKFVWKGEDAAKPVAPVVEASAKAKIETPDAQLAAVDTMGAGRHGADVLAQQPLAGAAPADSDFAQKLEQYQQKLDLARRADVAGQAVVQVKNVIDQGGGEIRIKLTPPELGEIHVDLVVKDGSVSGRISATDPAVVNALASDVKQFGEGLKQAGFKLGSDGLSFMLSQQNSQQQQNQNQQQAQNSNAGNWLGGNVEGDETAVVQAAVWVAPDRLLDVNI